MQPQIDGIIAFQHFAFLLPLMKAATFLGNEEFFLLLIPLVYLCVDARLGVRLGLLILLGDSICNFAKIAFHAPRPFWKFNNGLHVWGTEKSFGLPSSHAQNAFSVWFFLAGEGRKKWMWPVAALLVFVVSLSRIFLGLHFWSDVIGGWIIGAFFLFAFLKLEGAAARLFNNLSLGSQIAVAAFVAAMLLAIGFVLVHLVSGSLSGPGFPAANDAKTALFSHTGALFGLIVGWALACRFARFDARGPVALRALRFVIAIIGLLFFWRGLAAIFPKDDESYALFFRFIRYALMSGWITFGAPFLLLKMKLARKAPLEIVTN